MSEFEFNEEGRGVPTSREPISFGSLMQSSTVDFVEAVDGAVIVVEAPSNVVRQMSHGFSPDEVDIRRNVELGRSGTVWSNYLREEYNPELVGQAGLIKYERMAKSDAAVRSALRAVKTPILGATWFVQPAKNEALHKEIANFVQRNLTQYMTYQWSQVLWEALLMLNYGHYMFELVWAFRDVETDSGTSRKIVLKKMAPRHPLDITNWLFDVHGGPAGVEVFGPPASDVSSGVGMTSNSPFGGESVVIPIDKMAIFTFDGEGGDLRGISVLRSAYKHWFFRENLYKIDAIQKERHGIGIPIIKLPSGFTSRDRDLAHELGANLRTNEKAHVVLPPNWELMFAKLEGQPVDALESADHHMKMIYQNVLAQAIMAGSGASAKEGMELFYKSTRYIADIVRGVMNKYVIPKLVTANWPVDEFPELKVRRLGDTQEARTVSFAVRNFVGASVITPDERLEEWARELVDAPQSDPDTRREDTQTPQLPSSTPGNLTPPDENVGEPRVGPPRQTTTARQQLAPRDSPGADRSGG